MKKLVSIALIVLFTVSVFAQGQQEQQRKQKYHEFTADQVAELQTKKMVLNLDLTEKQQHKILEINKRNAVERKQKMSAHKAFKQSGKKLNTNEIFERKSQHLDKQIAHKAEMKKILSEKQFEVWTKVRKLKVHKIKRKVTKRKMHQKRMRR